MGNTCRYVVLALTKKCTGAICVSEIGLCINLVGLQTLVLLNSHFKFRAVHRLQSRHYEEINPLRYRIPKVVPHYFLSHGCCEFVGFEV